MANKVKLVVGLGKTGQSILNYFARENIACIAFDTRDDVDLAALNGAYPNVKMYVGFLPKDVWLMIDEVVASPGVALDEAVLVKAKQLGLKIVGDIELFARVCKGHIVAITGTNGKSTVTSLVYEIAKKASWKVACAGNIGTPVLDTLTNDFDLWVLELSSFQLDTIESLKPDVACLLNVSDDHLDRYANFKAYVKAKKHIFHYAKHCVFNLDDINTTPDKIINAVSISLENLKANWYVVQKNGVFYLTCGGKPIIPVDLLKIKGRHNQINALAALAIGELIGLPLDATIHALEAFPGLMHRCQWIASKATLEWYNDSKGTNVGSTVAAIEGLAPKSPNKVVLIAGGLGKGADFSPLRHVVSSFVRCVILMGEAKEEIALVLKNSVPIIFVSSMFEAVDKAAQKGKSGDIVLLSPACASFDMFNNFEHRGEQFVASVNAL